MRDELKRLARLAEAQQKLTRLLEARIAAGRARLMEMKATRATTVAAVEWVGETGLPFYSAVIRRVVELDRAMESQTLDLSELDRRLLDAKSRVEIFNRRIQVLEATRDRRLAEVDLVELSSRNSQG